MSNPDLFDIDGFAMRICEALFCRAMPLLAVFLIVACGNEQTDADKDTSSSMDSASLETSAQPDLSQEVAALAERGTPESRAAYQKLLEMGDAAVPALQAGLADAGRAVDEITDNEPTDERGFPTYSHLDPDDAERARAQRNKVMSHYNTILRLLQLNDTPAAQAALLAYYESLPPARQPPEVILDPASKPVRVWSALGQVNTCGKYDDSTAQLARARMGPDEDPTVRANAVHLAVQSGLADEVRPIALAMAETAQHIANGGDIHVLMTLAYLMSPEELQVVTDGKRFRPGAVKTAVYAARFIHGDNDTKYAVIKEAHLQGNLEWFLLNDVYVREMLKQKRIDWLQEFWYIQVLENDELRIAPDERRLFAQLGYNVTVDGSDVTINRLSCW